VAGADPFRPQLSQPSGRDRGSRCQAPTRPL